MRLRAMSVLGLFLAAAGTCDAVSEPDTCIQNRTYVVGSKVTEDMAAGDCDFGGEPTDLYKISVATQTTIKFIVTATGGANPTFSITKDTSTASEKTVVMRDGLGKTVTTYATLLPGKYVIGVSAGDGPEDGAYTLESSLVSSPAPVGCVTVFTGAATSHVWTMRGTQQSGAITADDCVNNSFLSDTHFIYMEAGRVYKITVVATNAGINVELNHDGSNLLHQNTANNAAGTVTMQYQANVSMRVGIGLIGIPAGGKPSYTLKIE